MATATDDRAAAVHSHRHSAPLIEYLIAAAYFVGLSLLVLRTQHDGGISAIVALLLIAVASLSMAKLASVTRWPGLAWTFFIIAHAPVGTGLSVAFALLDDFAGQSFETAPMWFGATSAVSFLLTRVTFTQRRAAKATV